VGEGVSCRLTDEVFVVFELFTPHPPSTMVPLLPLEKALISPITIYKPKGTKIKWKK